jgi:hypothetical protein
VRNHVHILLLYSHTLVVFTYACFIHILLLYSHTLVVFTYSCCIGILFLIRFLDWHKCYVCQLDAVSRPIEQGVINFSIRKELIRKWIYYVTIVWMHVPTCVWKCVCVTNECVSVCVSKWVHLSVCDVCQYWNCEYASLWQQSSSCVCE